MSEIQTINQGPRKLYCIRPEFKDSIKTLLQGDGMPNISTTENNASVPSANESQNVPIPTVNIPSGLQLVRRISQELQEPNKFPVPLEVIAFMKAFLGDFAPTKLDKMTMILNGIFKHLRRDEIEVNTIDFSVSQKITHLKIVFCFSHVFNLPIDLIVVINLNYMTL